MSKKLPEEILGLEYDWLGCDPAGRVAFFSTAGAGFAPGALLEDTDAFAVAIEAVLAAPENTIALSAPELAAGCVNTWKLMADHGFFAYDSDPNGGPYRLVAEPKVPAHLDDLPQAIVEVVKRVRFESLQFGISRTLTSEMLKADLTP